MKKHGILVDSETAQTEVTVNLKCELCEYEAKRVEHIHRHRETVHSDVRKYLCQTCGIGFKRMDALKLHTLTHTTNPNWDIKELNITHDDIKFLECEICLKSFKNHLLLLKHIKAIHNSLGAHVCEVCFKKFNTAFKLKRHSGTHERAVPESGDIQDYNSSFIMDQSGNLVQHESQEILGQNNSPLEDNSNPEDVKV